MGFAKDFDVAVAQRCLTASAPMLLGEVDDNTDVCRARQYYSKLQLSYSEDAVTNSAMVLPKVARGTYSKYSVGPDRIRVSVHGQCVSRFDKNGGEDASLVASFTETGLGIDLVVWTDAQEAKTWRRWIR